MLKEKLFFISQVLNYFSEYLVKTLFRNYRVNFSGYALCFIYNTYNLSGLISCRGIAMKMSCIIIRDNRRNVSENTRVETLSEKQLRTIIINVSVL